MVFEDDENDVGRVERDGQTLNKCNSSDGVNFPRLVMNFEKLRVTSNPKYPVIPNSKPHISGKPDLSGTQNIERFLDRTRYLGYKTHLAHYRQ